MDSEAFTKKNSLAMKGVAILLMLWHHCFVQGWFDGYDVDFRPLGVRLATGLAAYGKVCVCLFAFVSGYGLYLSYQKREKGRHITNWVAEKLIRTLSGYWFVIVLCWIVCGLVNGRTYEIYGFASSKVMGLWNMLMDFLGVLQLTGGRQLNGTWWYMGAAVIYVLLLPLICAGFERIGCLCTMAVVFLLPRVMLGCPGGTHFLTFLPIFCFGMIFARYGLFARWKRFWAGRRGGAALTAARFAALLAVAALGYRLWPEEMWWEVKYGVFPLALILALWDVVFRCPVLSDILVFLGRHATNIYLVHALILMTYCRDLLYGLSQCFLIYGALLLSSLACSLVIEGLKKAVRYQAGIETLADKVKHIKFGQGGFGA